MSWTVKRFPSRSACTLAALTLCISFNAYSTSSFDPSNNRLSMTSLSVSGVAYQNVLATLHSFAVLGLDNGPPGTNTYDPANKLLTLGSFEFQGTTYYNVRVQLNSVSLLAATPVTNASASPSSALPSASTCNQPNFQTEVMALINQARAAGRTCGNTMLPAVAPLVWNSKLFNASAGHSADMANNNYFSHTSQNGRTFGQRLAAAGYSGSRLGENIAAGQNSVASVMASWMSSAGHCSNIMNGNFTEVGMACVANPSANYRNYWTMDLGRP